MLAFEDVVCIETEMEDVYRVYRSDAMVRLGPDDLPCMGFTFVIKRKTGMEIYIALYARDIKRSLIYRVDPQTRGIGDPSSQLKSGLDLLKGLGFELNPVNLKYGSAMLEVVLQDVPVFMTPAKAKKTLLERNANLSALETQAAYIEEHDLLDADDKTLAKLSKEDRNRYSTAKTAYQRLAHEDHCDELREFLFDHIDALLHGRTPPKPGSVHPAEPVPKPSAPPSGHVPRDDAGEKSAKPAPAPQKKQPAEPETPGNQKPAEPDAPKPKTVSDPKDKARISELEHQCAEFKERIEELEGQNQQLADTLEVANAQLKKAKGTAQRVKELEAELEVAHHDADEAQKEVRRLKSENAKSRRKLEELEDQISKPAPTHEEPVRPRSRLNTGRSLLSSAGSSYSKTTGDPPHVVRRPPPAGATFGVDWDLEMLPCDSLDQVVELHQSICNAQLTLEGYSTQYCSAFIAVLKENGGRQLYMVFRLPQEDRFLIYKPIKKPKSSSDITQLLKEAHKFLQVVGVETEKITVKTGQELPSQELAELFGEI